MIASPGKAALAAIAVAATGLSAFGAAAQSVGGGGTIAIEQRMARPDFGVVGVEVDLGANATLVSEGMWEGMSRRRAATLMDMAAAQTGIAALDTLFMQTLAVAAGSPRRDEDREAETIGNPWLEARVATLVSRGYYDVAIGLGERLGTAGRAANPAVEADLLDAYLWGQGLAAACDVPWRLEAQSRQSAAPSLQLLDAACKAKAGDMAGAEFAAELAREFGAQNAIGFTLLDMMTGLKAGKLTDAQFEAATKNALAFAIAQQVVQPWPRDKLRLVPPAILAVWAAQDDRATIDRVMAAELARGAGFGSRNLLRGLYQHAAKQVRAGKLKPNDRTAALLDRALAFDTWRRDATGARGVDLLAGLLARAEDDGQFLMMADLLTSDFKFPQASADFKQHAALFARATIAVGQTKRAGQWLAYLLQGQGAGAFLLDPTIRALWPLMMLSELPVNKVIEDGALPWLASLTDETRPQAALIFSMAEALGRRIPEAAWLTLQDGKTDSGTAATLPPLTYWRGIAAAAGRGSRAEVIVLANLLLQSDGDAMAHPAVVSSVLSGLNGIGAGAIAHQIAVEAAFQAGF